ncbi:hypothetical protein WA158_002341 [Blastocystis sp. Blastoise]
MDALKEELDNAYEVISELEKTVESNNHNNNELVEEIQNLKSELIALEEQNDKFRSENEEIGNQNDDMKKQVSSLENEVNKYRKSNNEFFEEIQQLQTENKELQSKNDELERQVQKLKNVQTAEATATKANELEKTQSETLFYQRQLEQKDKQIKKISDEIVSLQNQVKSSMSDFDQLNEKYSTLKDSSEKIKNDLTVKNQMLEDESVELKDQLNSIKDQFLVYKEKFEALGDITPEYVDDLKNTIDGAKQRIEELTKQIEDNGGTVATSAFKVEDFNYSQSYGGTFGRKQVANVAHVETKKVSSQFKDNTNSLLSSLDDFLNNFGTSSSTSTTSTPNDGKAKRLSSRLSGQLRSSLKIDLNPDDDKMLFHFQMVYNTIIHELNEGGLEFDSETSAVASYPILYSYACKGNLNYMKWPDWIRDQLNTAYIMRKSYVPQVPEGSRPNSVNLRNSLNQQLRHSDILKELDKVPELTSPQEPSSPIHKIHLDTSLPLPSASITTNTTSTNQSNSSTTPQALNSSNLPSCSSPISAPPAIPSRGFQTPSISTSSNSSSNLLKSPDSDEISIGSGDLSPINTIQSPTHAPRSRPQKSSVNVRLLMKGLGMKGGRK